MEIRGISNSSRIVGLSTITQMRLHPEETTTRIVRFSFNVHSLSFVLVERPTEYGIQRGRNTVRVIKVRCVEPRVEFRNIIYCNTVINYLYFDESSIDRVLVALEDYAVITCKKTIVKEEWINLEGLSD